MSNIIDSLQRIRNHQFAYYENLAYLPLGLTSEQKQILLDGFPFLLTKELSDIFCYQVDSISFDPVFSLLSLEDSLDQSLFYLGLEIPRQAFYDLGISHLRYFRGCFKSDVYQKVITFYPHDYCLLPIARGFCKEVYLVKCSKAYMETSSIFIQFTGGNLIEYAESLTSLILTIAECYEENAYYPKFDLFDEDFRIGEWIIEENLNKVEFIFEKYNPNHIKTWREIWKN
jgi:hypothetical protein